MQLNGALMHLTNIVRPDITYTVQYLARFIRTPTELFWKGCKHILKYLKGTKGLKIRYRNREQGTVVVFLDEDWAQEKPSRKSISGYCFKFEGGLWSWRSKQQTIVAQSSKEAEFLALEFCVREVICLKKCKDIMKLVLPNDDVDRMFNISSSEENIACIKDVHSPKVSEMSKNVDLKYQFLVDYVGKGNMGLHYVSTDKMMAAIMTKSLKRTKFIEMMTLTEICWMAW